MKKYRLLGLPIAFVLLLGIFISILPLTIPIAVADARSLGAQPDWSLLWSDEFTGTGALNTNNWLYDIGTSYPGGPPNWGNEEIESMSDSTSNVFQSGGVLNIRAYHTGSNPLNGWTSGRIETQRTDFQPPPGGIMAVEASIRLPNVTGDQAQGYWPAFWMLGAPYRGNYQNWPSVGEVDIMENVNGLNEWSGAFHCGYDPGGPCNEHNGLGGGYSGFSPSLQETYHIYRFEFDRSVSPQQLRWYVDGVKLFSLDSDQVDPATWSEATDHGFFIILDLAIGGSWAGNPTMSTANEGTMLVDYVRVYVKPAQLIFLPLVRRN